MAKYQRKPHFVDAVQWDGDLDTANAFLGERYDIDWQYIPDTDAILFQTGVPKLGMQRADVGDWLVKHGDGNVHMVRDEIFRQHYDAVAGYVLSPEPPGAPRAQLFHCERDDGIKVVFYIATPIKFATFLDVGEVVEQFIDAFKALPSVPSVEPLTVTGALNVLQE